MWREGGSLGCQGPPPSSSFQLALVCPGSPPGPPPSASPLSHTPQSWPWGRHEEHMWTRPEPCPLPPPTLDRGPQLAQFLSLNLEMPIPPELKCLPLLYVSSRGQPEPAQRAQLGAARLGGALRLGGEVRQAPPAGCVSHRGQQRPLAQRGGAQVGCLQAPQRPEIMAPQPQRSR